MSFLQLVLSLDKTIKEIILLWRICQFDRYRNIPHFLSFKPYNKFWQTFGKYFYFDDKWWLPVNLGDFRQINFDFQKAHCVCVCVC